MSALAAALLAAIPQAFLAIGLKLFTQSFMQTVIEEVLIFGLRKAAAMTTNTVDDDLVEKVAARLKDGGANA